MEQRPKLQSVWYLALLALLGPFYAHDILASISSRVSLRFQDLLGPSHTFPQVLAEIYAASFLPNVLFPALILFPLLCRWKARHLLILTGLLCPLGLALLTIGLHLNRSLWPIYTGRVLLGWSNEATGLLLARLAGRWTSSSHALALFLSLSLASSRIFAGLGAVVSPYVVYIWESLPARTLTLLPITLPDPGNYGVVWAHLLALALSFISLLACLSLAWVDYRWERALGNERDSQPRRRPSHPAILNSSFAGNQSAADTTISSSIHSRSHHHPSDRSFTRRPQPRRRASTMVSVRAGGAGLGRRRRSSTLGSAESSQSQAQRASMGERAPLLPTHDHLSSGTLPRMRKDTGFGLGQGRGDQGQDPPQSTPHRYSYATFQPHSSGNTGALGTHDSPPTFTDQDVIPPTSSTPRYPPRPSDPVSFERERNRRGEGEGDRTHSGDTSLHSIQGGNKECSEEMGWFTGWRGFWDLSLRVYLLILTMGLFYASAFSTVMFGKVSQCLVWV